MARNSMKDTTPYHARPAAEVERERACMEVIFARAKPVEAVWEAFGGTGITMGVLAKRFPGVPIRACEIDAQCVESYNRAASGQGDIWCVQADATTWPRPFKPDVKWGASLDFNRFTILDVRRKSWKAALVRRVREARPAWIQLTDSARPYLHVKWQRSYNLPDRQPETYLAALSAELGLKIVAEAHHRAATYLLMEGEQ